VTSVRLVEIRRYPVKSLRGHALEAGQIERIGLAGDRRWMIVDSEAKFLTQRQHPKLAQIDAEPFSWGVRLSHDIFGGLDVAFPDEDGPTERVVVWRDQAPARVAAEASAFLSSFLGAPVRLVFFHDRDARPVDPTFGRPDDRVSFADGFPILLTSIASLGDLNRRAKETLTMDRFRANLVIDGAAPWAEDCWRRIRVGGLTFRIVKPCARCAIPTLDPTTGARLESGEPLRTLAKFHRAANGGVIFGQNLIPDEFGPVRTGDSVEVLEIGPSNLH
jgi:uncharacterized protein